MASSRYNIRAASGLKNGPYGSDDRKPLTGRQGKRLQPAPASVGWLGLLAASCLTSSSATGEVLARNGDATPRNNATFAGFGAPLLAPNGDVAFPAQTTSVGPLGQGLFRRSAAAPGLRTVVESDDPTPDSNGNIWFTFGSSFAMDPLGNIVWDAPVLGSLGGVLDDYAVYMTDVDGVTFAVVRENDRVPGGNGRFASDPSNLNLVLSDGAVGFVSDIRAIPDGNGVTAQGVFRWTPEGIVELARTDEEAPEGGMFYSFKRKRIGMTTAGEVVIVGTLHDSRTGIYRFGEDAVARLAGQGDRLPDGGILDAIDDPALNRSGGAAFRAELTDTPEDQLDNEGVFFAGAEGLREVARKGAFAPSNVGRYRTFDPKVAVNDSGQVLFFAELTGASNGESQGWFLHDGASTVAVALNNRAAPGGDILRFELTNFRSGCVNNSGQAVFVGPFLQGGLGAGLYFFDPSTGLHLVARTGDAFGEEGTVANFGFADGFSGFGGGNVNGLNDAGEVAFTPILTGARTMVARWSYDSVRDNLPPIAEGLFVEVTQGQRLVLTVPELLGAAADPEGGALALRSIDPVTSGGRPISLDPVSGSYFYDAPLDGLAVDEFNYLVADAAGATVTVTGQIRLLPVNRAPTGAGWTLGSRYGNPLVVEAVRLLAAAADPDGDHLSIASIDSRTGEGRSIFAEDDRIVIAAPEIEWLTDSFSYVVSDGRGGTVSIRVTIKAEDAVSFVGNGSGGRTLQIAAVEGSWTVERAGTVKGPWVAIGVTDVVYDGPVPGPRRPPVGSVLGRGILVDEELLPGGAFYRVVR
ncbi:MAG: cadherin-like domain-containing protein [Verrucomicrobiales bacterium]|nr:cadherin-like domain-containing protein [Verrucomicrobiales bacterium]MCP5527322.1 cadherin-like domain-containing protein [Verrucomicrobiales bacterium]